MRYLGVKSVRQIHESVACEGGKLTSFVSHRAGILHLQQGCEVAVRVTGP